MKQAPSIWFCYCPFGAVGTNTGMFGCVGVNPFPPLDGGVSVGVVCPLFPSVFGSSGITLGGVDGTVAGGVELG